MSSRFNSKSHTNLAPGPGAYDGRFNTMYKTAPGWKIGTSERDEDAKRARKTGDWPDPASYSPNTHYTKMKNAAWVIGSSQRNSMNSKTLTPAPNAYSPP